jgi:hypothetical protein
VGRERAVLVDALRPAPTLLLGAAGRSPLARRRGRRRSRACRGLLLRLPVVRRAGRRGDWYARQATLRAERVEWAAARDNTLDRADLAAIADAAATDSLNPRPQLLGRTQEIEGWRLARRRRSFWRARRSPARARAAPTTSPRASRWRRRAAATRRARAPSSSARTGLEPWRRAVAPALAQLLIASGRSYAPRACAPRREGDAAVATLRELAEALAAGRTRAMRRSSTS